MLCSIKEKKLLLNIKIQEAVLISISMGVY
jgi:hypothetical protein